MATAFEKRLILRSKEKLSMAAAAHEQGNLKEALANGMLAYGYLKAYGAHGSESAGEIIRDVCRDLGYGEEKTKRMFDIALSYAKKRIKKYET